MKTSGIGGQAVLEGIMMRNGSKYAVAVRKPDKDIAVVEETYHGLFGDNKFVKLPFIRGIFNFIDSMVLGVKTINISAEFFVEEEDETSGGNAAKKAADPAVKTDGKAADAKAAGEAADAKAADAKAAGSSSQTEKQSFIEKHFTDEQVTGFVTAIAVVISLMIAMVLFMVLPVWIASFFRKLTDSYFLIALLEGVLRVLIFICYIVLVGQMKDIKRTYMYHGAEHKCINCIETGLPLTVDNVAKSSKVHKRCGTSFLLFVMLISVFVFMFIRVDNIGLRMLSRVILVPLIAGISYEIIRIAGCSDNPIVNAISRPGLWMQGLTTKEPERDMIEVAIQAVEKVFDWKAFQKEVFGTDHGSEMEKEEDCGPGCVFATEGVSEVEKKGDCGPGCVFKADGISETEKKEVHGTDAVFNMDDVAKKDATSAEA